MNIIFLVDFMGELRPQGNAYTQMERERMRKIRDKGQLGKFNGADYVLVKQDDLFQGEKICIW